MMVRLKMPVMNSARFWSAALPCRFLPAAVDRYTLLISPVKSARFDGASSRFYVLGA
jgi:hypothetical protein